MSISRKKMKHSFLVRRLKRNMIRGINTSDSEHKSVPKYYFYTKGTSRMIRGRHYIRSYRNIRLALPTPNPYYCGRCGNTYETNYCPVCKRWL